MSQSGRYYTPAMVETTPTKPVERLLKIKEEEMVLDIIKESITEKEASKFSKFIKHSEYNVVEQLN